MTNSSTRVELPDAVPVRLQSFLSTGKGKMLNLSSSGAYVATAMYLLPQASVRLSIVLRDEKRWVETDAVVVWENRGTVGRRDGLPPGYGFRFIDPDRETTAVIDGMLRAAAAAAGPEPAAPPASAPAPVPAPELPVAVPARAGAFAPPRDEEPAGPPYRLREEVIARETSAQQPGVYVLSYDRTLEARIGRADTDLRETLTSFQGEYAYFYVEVIEDEEERYFRECELFHRMGGDRGQLDNTAHPVPPESGSIECPVCIAERVR